MGHSDKKACIFNSQHVVNNYAGQSSMILAPLQKRLWNSTSTGNVWAHPILSYLSVLKAMLTPCVMTHPHTHEEGQWLTITGERGWVREMGGKPQNLNFEDMVGAPQEPDIGMAPTSAVIWFMSSFPMERRLCWILFRMRSIMLFSRNVC